MPEIACQKASPDMHSPSPPDMFSPSPPKSLGLTLISALSTQRVKDKDGERGRGGEDKDREKYKESGSECV